MLTESLFLHVFADNIVYAVTSGVDFWNIQEILFFLNDY